MFSAQVQEFLNTHHIPFHWKPASFGGVLHLPQHNNILLLVECAKARQEDILATQTQLRSATSRVICLWEDVWFSQREKVEIRLEALCGLAKKIHARQTKVVRIDAARAEVFLHRYHLQYYTNAYYKYALQYKNETVAVCTFSKSRVMHDGVVPYRSYELVRYAVAGNLIINGGLSKLLSYFITQHHPAHLMTYIDLDWGNGNSFMKLGFKEDAQLPIVEYYVHPHSGERIPAWRATEQYSCKVWNSGSLKLVLDLRS